MTSRAHSQSAFANSLRALHAAVCVLALSALPASVRAQPSPSATAAYNAYISSVESRLDRHHQSRAEFLANLPPGSPRDLDLRSGALLLENLTPPSPGLPGALLSHWRATAFVPGATALEFTALLRNFSAYPRVFAPQVIRASELHHSGAGALITLRMLQHHVLTVTVDGTFRVAFGQLDPHHAFSTSASTSILEIVSAGKPGERPLSPDADHGFLWRMNSWWSYEERDGGLYIQLESVSLSRSIPFGLAWAVRPYVESIPRDSLTFTLNAARRALQQSSRATESSSRATPRKERNR